MVIPAVVMAVLTKSLRFRESVVLSAAAAAAAAVEPWELVAVSEGDDLARGVMALVAPVSRSRMLVELIDGCDDGCGYRAGYWLLM